MKFKVITITIIIIFLSCNVMAWNPFSSKNKVEIKTPIKTDKAIKSIQTKRFKMSVKPVRLQSKKQLKKIIPNIHTNLKLNGYFYQKYQADKQKRINKVKAPKKVVKGKTK